MTLIAERRAEIQFLKSLILLDMRIESRSINCQGNRRDGVVVKASASQSIDMGFISQVESYQKTFKNDMHSFPDWRSAK